MWCILHCLPLCSHNPFSPSTISPTKLCAKLSGNQPPNHPAQPDQCVIPHPSVSMSPGPYMEISMTLLTHNCTANLAILRERSGHLPFSFARSWPCGCGEATSNYSTPCRNRGRMRNCLPKRESFGRWDVSAPCRAQPSAETSHPRLLYQMRFQNHQCLWRGKR